MFVSACLDLFINCLSIHTPSIYLAIMVILCAFHEYFLILWGVELRHVFVQKCLVDVWFE